ncbi:ribosome maturation factor RimM [Saccharopolyspora sp. WRP15-2]|uniref:Ribosome maturation factor RimM n=1 Tax=Saccharopolyspora oryzae TaxID=2997343 RepID=A0ABT4V776_9PSEU|nr:ribosome maturation factor RimM [Saccharopolyspora oryzae]MDA3629820.1 ribosome maturation factor RimM [Saccharopolyspora oryzae]
MADPEQETLAVGRIVRPHGVRGELVVEVLTDSPELRFAPGSVLGTQRRGKGRGQNLTVAAARPHAGRLLLRAEGVDGREAAEDLRGVTLTVTADVLEPTDDPDEFHDHELVGLRAVQVSGEEVGEVSDVVHTPAGELLALRTADDREVLVPFVAEIVPEIDLAAGKLVIDPPEGLLDE